MGCPVCIEDYNETDRQPLITWCGHSCCMLCIARLVENLSSRCPICRTALDWFRDTTYNFALQDASREMSLLRQNNEELQRNNGHLVAECRRMKDLPQSADRDFFTSYCGYNTGFTTFLRGGPAQSVIKESCETQTRLENGWRPVWMAPNTVLLGDSGYANTEYVVTPILHPMTAQERRYNRSHRRTRRVVECAIGLLKQRFRCLLLPQHLAPVFVGEIVRCCAVLHNMLLGPDEAAMFEDDDNWRPDQFLDRSDDDDEYDNGEGEGVVGRRQQLVQMF